jgi:hypothetical protein
LLDSVFKVSAVVRIEEQDEGRQKLGGDSDRVVIAYDVEAYEQIVVTLRSWLDKPPAQIARVSQRPISSQRRRPLSSATSPTSTSFSFLKSQSIEWLQPAAYFPHFWDSLSGSSNCDTHTGSNFLDSQGEGLDEFMSRYMLQHTSFVCSDRIYFCVEERQYASHGSAAISKEKIAPGLDVLEAIQNTYCPLNDFHGINVSLLDARKNTRSPLKITGQLSQHRTKDVHKSDFILTFPNILKARSSLTRGEYHFCAALNLNLVETSAFCDGGFTSDQIRFFIFMLNYLVDDS